MATRDSDSSDSSSAASGQRLVCELSPKNVVGFAWQSSTDANGEYFSKWDRTAHADLIKTGNKYYYTGPIKSTKLTVSMRWYLKDADNKSSDSGMTGSSSND